MEIASLNNRLFRTLGSSLVIAADDRLKIALQPSGDYFVTVDQLDIPQDQMAAVHYRVAKKNISGLYPTAICIFGIRVQDAFIGDIENMRFEYQYQGG